MITTDVEHIDLVQWQNLLQMSSIATWFQSEEAYRFYASLPTLMQPFVIAVSMDSQLKGIVVGYITQEKNPIKQFFTRRAIIIGGPLLADDITSAELNELLVAVCSSVGSKAIYIETRNFNDYSHWRSEFESVGFKYQPHLNFHVDTTSVITIDGNLGKGRKRDIKTSLRDGANIIEQPTLEQVKDYYKLLSHLYNTKVKTPLFPWEFFEHLYELKSAHFILVEYNDEIIGGTACMSLEHKTLYEWFVCGQDGCYKAIFPSSLATYAGLCYAANHGLSTFDMMGAGVPNEAYGVRDFKARFGGKLVEYGRWLKIENRMLYAIGKCGVLILKAK